MSRLALPLLACLARSLADDAALAQDDPGPSLDAVAGIQ